MATACECPAVEDAEAGLWSVVEHLSVAAPPLDAERVLGELQRVTLFSSRITLYKLQTINVLLVRSGDFRRGFTLKRAAELLGHRALERITEGSDRRTVLHAGIVCYNVLLHTLPGCSIVETPTMLAQSLFACFLRGYFAAREANSDKDDALQWLIFSLGLLVTVTPAAFSPVAFCLECLDGAARESFLELLVQLVDQVVREQSAHSLVVDAPARLVERNAEVFGEAKAGLGFKLKLADTAVLATLVWHGAEKAAPVAEANAAIKVLIDVTFLGGYNAPLQQTLSLGTEGEHLFTALATLLASERDEPELATNCVRLASNLIHANPRAQEFLLNAHLLPAFLARTQRTDSDPHAKEAIVVFVRYMTESSERARREIAALKVDDFVKENANFMKKMEII